MSRLEHTPRRSTVGCGAAVARPPKPERDGAGGGLLRRRSRRPLCLFEVAEQHRERHRAAATGYRTPVEGDLGRVLAVERDDDEFSSNGTPAHSTHRCYPNRDVRGAIPTCARRSRRPTATATHRCRDRTARWEGLPRYRPRRDNGRDTTRELSSHYDTTRQPRTAALDVRRVCSRDA